MSTSALVVHTSKVTVCGIQDCASPLTHKAACSRPAHIKASMLWMAVNNASPVLRSKTTMVAVMVLVVLLTETWSVCWRHANLGQARDDA
jgi:hypothetical protein